MTRVFENRRELKESLMKGEEWQTTGGLKFWYNEKDRVSI